MPPENGQPAANGDAARKRDETVNPFVAQQAVDMDALRKQKRLRVGKAGPRFFLSGWCVVPAGMLLAWCGLHAYLGHAAGVPRETVIALGTGAGALLIALLVAVPLAKVIDPGRVAASVAFSAILAIAVMGSVVRVVVQQQHVAAATPLSAWVMEPFMQRPTQRREVVPPADGVEEADVAMQQLAERMRVGTIDTSKMGKGPIKTEKTDIRMTVRKRKSVGTDGELAEAKEGQ